MQTTDDWNAFDDEPLDWALPPLGADGLSVGGSFSSLAGSLFGAVPGVLDDEAAGWGGLTNLDTDTLAADEWNEGALGDWALPPLGADGLSVGGSFLSLAGSLFGAVPGVLDDEAAGWDGLTNLDTDTLAADEWNAFDEGALGDWVLPPLGADGL